MGIFDKFKSKPPDKPKTKSPKKEENVLDMVADTPKVEKSKEPKKSKSNTGSAYRHLIRPQITEKATMLSAGGKYVFRVHPDSNKNEIRKAVEKVYDVHVVAVNVINVSGKARRYGRVTGRTRDWKKAVVTVRKGEHIAGITATEQA